MRGWRVCVDALRCPRCGGTVSADGAYADCDACGAAYPVLSGVPVMCRDAVALRAPTIDAATAAAVLRALGLPADPLRIVRVRAATRWRAKLGGPVIETEARQFLDRLRGSGHAIPDDQDSVPRSMPPSSGPSACRWIVDHIPRVMPAGRELTANVRFLNAGGATMPCAGPHAVRLAHRWTELSGAERAEPDMRTQLPVDVPPGQEITVPIRLAAPAEPGRFLLKLLLVQEGIRWLDEDAALIPIRVDRDSPAAEPGPAWALSDQRPSSYDADHLEAAEMLRGWLPSSPARPLRILEVGGNAHPMIGGLPGALFNVDVDLLGLQMGELAGRARGSRVHHVCADAADLPFAPEFFDVIAIFASLHHFRDPVALLRHLRGHLAPGGFVAVMCEPVGHIWPGAVRPDFLHELEKGVNEQSFTIGEYARMFRAARLDVQEAAVAFDSLKARLAPMPEGRP